MTALILAVGFVVIISAGCSMFEAVFYSVPLRHLETMARSKRKSGIILKRLRKNVDKPITAILTLNTISNTAGASIAGAMAATVFGREWLGYFSVFFTLAILIFSEVIPKTAGVVYSRRLAAFVAYPLAWLVSIMKPVIWMISLLTGIISRNKPDDSVSPDEIKIMAQAGLRTGSIERYQEMVIANVLSLGNRHVKDVMTPRTVIFSLNQDLSVEDAYSETKQWEHSRIPVYDKGPEDIVGVVLTKELFKALAEDRKSITLKELMRPVRFVVEAARLNNVLMDFINTREKLFAVIDEYGGLSGVVSLEDILEEILGREILDEFDQVDDKRKLAKLKRQMLFSDSFGNGT
ncbi:MAG: hemolysin family protein [Desulfobacteraceae bacterium]|jgi:CBS domain containing-hemolysin-like protein